ncbi:TPA: hypothetical protein O6L53_002729 [Staphylococcus aureus]|nr:hypothetical protein [Staphylococcus aureus]HDB3143323.1 hypothetical protein [Staphylococcus aureus]HDE8374456.1 hypothetical protein [Staphylococcus aureus]
MKFEKIKEILGDKATIYLEKGGVNMAVNIEKGVYIKEDNDVYIVDNLETNDIDNIKEEDPIELYNMQKVGESLNMRRTQIKWAIESQNYEKVPKPMFMIETKRGLTYYWLPQQLKIRK